MSVIIPTFNRAGMIARAVESALSQTYRDFEVIVIDDGSSDDTKSVLARYNGKIKYIYQDNGGISAARNKGISESQGEYIAFLDSDDAWSEEKLAEQVKVLDGNPKIGIVYSRMPIVDESGKTIGMKPAGASGRNFHELLEIWGDLPTSSVMTRRECFEKAGTFDAELPTMEDIDMWLRIARTYDLYEIEGKALAFYFTHGEQTVSSKIKVYEGLIRVYAKILGLYPDAPKALMKSRLALNNYLLSRLHFAQKDYQNAWGYLKEAFRSSFLVGVLMADENSGIITKTIGAIKAYGYFIICYLWKSVLNRNH